MIGNREALFRPHHFRNVTPKTLEIKGSVEQILDSAPISEGFADNFRHPRHF